MTQNRRTCTLGQPCEPRNLTEVVHCVARHSAIDTHRLADALGVDYGRLVKWTEPNGRCSLPARLLAPLARATGRADHVEFLAREAGLLCVPMVDGAASQEPGAELLDIMEAVGALAARHRAALGDGRLDAGEIATLARLSQDIVREVFHYTAAAGAGK